MVLSREGATVIAADKNIKAAEETIKTYTAPSAGDRGLYKFNLKG